MRLKKQYGQHLLVSTGVLKKIVEELGVEEGDKVVEIGPGTGNLTLLLLQTPLAELHAIELDPDMLKILQRVEDKRLQLHHADASRFPLCSLGENLKVVGNLPYNVASLIVENTVLHHRCIPLALYMVQKEVGEKLQEGASWLSFFVRTFYDVFYIMSVPPQFFRPPPKVNSALVKLVRKDTLPQLDLFEYKKFLDILFSHRRKALKNKLESSILEKVGVDPMLRVEQLDLNTVLRLFAVWLDSKKAL
ncbi:dimethyladenosine transferase [Thermocrinis albus DSM 14484]|uniref:Ribosomal RNA small subunit methyltransferase A n=1 Tax=Thermocrinis albus (strain DSM 14484 / JCM 11386 / HI 11/12) TaxID=638303 RepID=D3SPY8_THEAH|nr:16S rRNA (adenine(1518)-N(6)/adenine(1519)-N(6))-dimethyltransferase RsmA [Thermocrinis albus]ADC89225.1 dimethyladenosine transferase [Thermocrinis albus DSM 14484]